MVDIARTLSLHGYVGWTLEGDDYNGLTWDVNAAGREKPTLVEIEAWAAEKPPPRHIDARDMMGRITQAKRIAIHTATEGWTDDLSSDHPAGPMGAETVRATLRDLLGQLYSGAMVNLENPETVAGIDFFLSLSLIDAADRAALLA